MALHNEISNKTDHVAHHEFSGEKGLCDETDYLDAVTAAPETTLESFADLDEKKILRKVQTYPRPMGTMS